MYLKRLESVGFKSFAERVSIEFVPGVTAVVGPNGSGKSNITDAIRWVLGEQSVRSLRGSRMEDIIFQGSDTRKPLNVAEVTLILDNSDQTLPLDFEEISITRRVYRSGESEFYINKQSCRLRDIIDLFMDSGLGREAFSIISQGKVEEILSSKAEERRIIFEEAAGVLKYKQRKQKAEFKLTETKDNLSRIDDIIYEIEQQIEPLYKQSQVAKQYIEKAEQLKKLEISVLVTEIEQLHNEWQQLLNEVNQEKTEEIHMKTAIQKKEINLERIRHTIHTVDEQIESLQAKLLSVTQQLEQYEGKKQVLSERTKHFSENKDKLERYKNDILISIQQLTTNLTEEKKKLDNLQKIRRKTEEKIQLLQTKLMSGQESIRETIEEQKAEYIELLNEQAAKRNEQQTIQQQLERISQKNTMHREKFQKLVKIRNEKETEKEQILNKYVQLEKAYNDQQKHIEQSKNKLSTERNRYETAKEKLYESYQMLAKLKSRKEMLKEMKDDYQGFFHGVKSILQASGENKLANIHGAVIELIDVPKKYISAIDTVLSSQAQNIVVTNEQAARNAILWLKQTNNGRATFLPLGSIHSRLLSTDLLAKIKQHPGFIDIAAKLVHTEKKYQIVVDHLLGNVVVTKTLKDANEIARLLKRRFRIVTVDGDMVNPGGSMSGGAKRRLNQSLFTRERELEEVSTKLNHCQTRVDAYEIRLEQQKKQIEQMEKNILQEEKSLRKAEEHLQNVQEEYQNIEMQLVSVRENITMNKNDHTLFEQDQDDLHMRNKKLTTALSEIKQELLRIQKKISQLTEKEITFIDNREQIKKELHEYQVSLAEQKERVRNQHEKTTTIHNQIKEMEEQYEKYTYELNELMQLKQSEETRQEIDQLINEKRAEKERYTKQLQQKRTERLRHTQHIEDEERELKEQTKQHQIMMQSIQQKEVKINRLDVELENRLSKLQTEYTISYEKAKNNYRKVENIEEMKMKVANLKQTIKDLGNVNLGAIDEYKRISERYQFLTDQKADLVEAKQTLYKIISEMDEVMKKRFDETFTLIKKEFAVVFKELFGGGHAELKLTDPKNILETGINIIAQPPGKKLQHLGLLSGGEKALTSIALLFSILRVRPVPFCVLDEVEAALDEVNVVRFANYLKLHSEETQFIVITHRKGTMEKADVLYGVTMQESGVSRLVSVQLEDSLELVSS